MSGVRPAQSHHDHWPAQVSISLDEHIEHARMVIGGARRGGDESAWYELYNLLLSFNALRGNHAHGGRVSVWPQPYLYRFLTRAVARAIHESLEDSPFRIPATRSTETSLVQLDSSSTESLSAVVTAQSDPSHAESVDSVPDAPSARHGSVGRGDIFQASDEDKEEDAKGQDQNTESEKQAGEDEDNDLQECQSESGQNVGKSEGYGEEKEEVGEEKDNDDEDEEENDLPFSAEEAQFRVPDFLVILTKATPERNTQFRNALIFWELKDCQGHDTATMLAANEQMHRRAQIMHATIPQLVQQAQFLFEHSPEQKIALGMVAVGLFFHRTRMPALSRDGKLKLLPPMKAAKIPTISNIHPIFNESGTEYSVAFKIIGPFRGSGQPRWRVEVEFAYFMIQDTAIHERQRQQESNEQGVYAVLDLETQEKIKQMVGS